LQRLRSWIPFKQSHYQSVNGKRKSSQNAATRFIRACVFSLIVSPLVALQCVANETILVYGDSLSAAYGMDQQAGWVTLLQHKLTHTRYPYQVVNASISGETTAGGVQRLAQTLKQHRPSIVILALGANDGLRGLPISEMRSNLANMLEQTQKAQAKTLLVGMKIPPNYGVKYTQAFADSFASLAKQHQLKFVPFLLDGVAGNPQLNQADGIHPVAKAQPMLLDNVWPQLQPLLHY